MFANSRLHIYIGGIGDGSFHSFQEMFLKVTH